MKILFITDLYPVTNNEKTTPRTLSNFVEDWQEAGHDVDVIKPNFILNSFVRCKPFYKSDCYGEVLNINYWTPFLFDVKQKLKKYGKINLSNYDLIIAHMPSGILFADKLGIPFVAGIHNSDLTVLSNPLYKIHFKKRMEKALQYAKIIACRSFVLKDKFLKLYPHFEQKTIVAPSGINEKEILSSINLANLDKERIRVLTCANYKKRKNIEKVLQAVNDLDCFEVTVIGKGTDSKNLRKLNHRAIFKGYLPHEKVLKEMKNSDIFILPSIGETFGMVYLEAMASGCITICTKDDGIDGIIKNKENGFTVQPDVNAIKKLLIDIKNMDNEALKVLQHNSFETSKLYTSKACSQNYLQQIFKIM